MGTTIYTNTLSDNTVFNKSLFASVLSTKLPKNLKIKGNLNISYSGITKIPEECIFTSLHMCYTRITNLPDNLKLDTLFAHNSKLKKLPNGLTVNNLNICSTRIKKIPSDCQFKNLNISYTKIKSIPDNLVLKNLYLNNSLVKKLPKNLTVEGVLKIDDTQITYIPNDCVFKTLEGYNSQITKLRNNLTIDNLILNRSKLIKLPKNLKIKGSLQIGNTAVTNIPNDCEYSALSIHFTKIKSLKDNLILDYLNLEGTPFRQLPNNLMVFSYINFINTYITSLPENVFTPTIYAGTIINDDRYECITKGVYKLKKEYVHITHSSGRKFLYVDGILSEVIKKRGNVYHVRNRVNEPISYAITDGENNWAHGRTLKEAKEDLLFKISSRSLSEYANLTLDDKLTYEEAIACYRIITGACRAGTLRFLEEHNLIKKHKKEYTIKEIIELTKNDYNGDVFMNFFKNKEQSIFNTNYTVKIRLIY